MENIGSELEIPVQKSNLLASSSISKSYPILKSSTPRTLDKIASGPISFKDSVVIKDKNTQTPEPLQERLIPPKETFEIPDLGGFQSINSNSSKSVYLSVLLNILFIASFLLEFQTGSANRMNVAIQKEIDEFPYSTQPMLYLNDATTMSDVSFFLSHVILGHVLDPNRIYTPTNYKNTLNEGLDSTWISSGQSGNTGSGTDSNGPQTGNTQNGNTPPTNTNPTEPSGPSSPSQRVLRDNKKIETKDRTLQSPSTTPYYFLNAFNIFKGMLITYYYNDQSSLQGEEFTLYYKATISGSDASTQSQALLKGLQNGYIKSVNIEIEFLNVIKQIGIYYQYSFQQDDQAEFKMSTDAQPFYPKTFDKDSYDSTTKTLIILFRVLFALSLLVQLVKVFAVDIYKAFKTLFQTHKLNLPLDVIYDIGLVVLLIIVLILSVDQSIRQRGTCTILETIDREKFLLFKSFANFQRFFVRLLSVTIAFLIIQILLLLNTQFPTFGILFYTLGQSKNKLATYGILILTLMAGFVSLMTLNFGQGDVSMDTFGKSLFLVFQYMVGGAEYKQLKAANEKLAGLYFVVFYIIFNLLIILLFIAIIMATYAQLRKKLQITTLALAELMAEKSEKLKEKYLNLILFRPPKQETLDEESLKRRRLSVHQIQQLKSQQEHKKKNLFAILLHNLEELDWFGCTNSNRMTRDEIENQVKEKIIQIRKRQSQREQDKINQRKTSLFGKLVNLLVHIIFIVVYTYTLNYELKRNQSFEINQAIGDYFLKSVFFSEEVQVNKTFNDITTVEDIIQWTREVYFNGIFEGFTNSDDSTIISSVFSQNNIISSAVSRINFRNLQMRPSKEVDNKKISFYIRSPNDISPSEKHASSEVQDEIVFPQMTIGYTHSGTHATFRKEGGYYWTFPRNKTLAQDYMNKIQHPKLLNINTGLMTLQTVYLNGNYELLGLCEFIISIKASGYIQKDYKTHVFQVNLSSCQDCRAKIACEIIYILFVLKQIYELAQQFREEWKKKESKKLTPIDKKFINKSWIVRALNHDVENSKFLSTLWAILVRLWQLFNRFITTTLNFWKKTYANLILSISFILTLCCFYYYLKIVFQGFRKGIDLEARPSDSADFSYGANEIGNYEELATLTNSYATLQAFNSWLIILRLLFEFGFSRELSFILDLIYGSLFDILFFSLTFLIIIFGFAIDGFLMFGPETEGFKDLGSAFLQILIWIISGRITDETVNEKIDSGTKAVFFIFLIVICLLILLKVFMAILDSQFMTLAASGLEHEHLGFFELIVHIIGEKVREKKIELQVISIPSNAGTLNKMRIQFMNKLYKTRYVILTRLKKTILQDEENTLSEEEFKKREQAAEDNKVAVQLNFRHYGGFGKEQREIELEDLQFYLRDANQPELTRGFSTVPNPEVAMTEDPFLNPAKWMNYLEENIQKVTSEKIKLAKYGSRAQDYVSLERKINPEIEQRLQSILSEARKQYPNEETITPQFFAENIAIPEYKKASKDKQNPNLYSTISDHLHFIYYKVLNQFGDVFSAAQANIDTPIESPFGQKHLKKKMMKLDHHIYREEYFNTNDLTLLNFWETLKIQHQYELWAGDNRDLISDDVRGCLWKLMKFDGALFTPFIDQKKFKTKGLSSKSIGLLELHWIWHSLTYASTTTSPRENLSDSEDIPNSNIDELSIKHMNLAENLIRGDDTNLIVKLRKNNTLQGKLKYLSSLKRVKNDKKLMLWLLTPLNKKTDIILRIQDPVLLRFTFFLLLEEVYDNTHLIHTVETGLNQEIKNKIYMFFFFFSHFEALQHTMKAQKSLNTPENNAATLEYIQFLEKQVESTNNVKKQYLRDINSILQKESEMKQQGDLVFSREDSGIPSSQQSFSPEKSRLTEDPLFLGGESGLSSPSRGFSPEKIALFREKDDSQKIYSPEKSRFVENEEKEHFLGKSFLTPVKLKVEEEELKEEEEKDKSPSQELAVLPGELDMQFESSSDEEAIEKIDDSVSLSQKPDQEEEEDI